MYTTSVFFAHLPFQTHDPTQPTKNKNSRISIHYQPNPTHGSTQPMDNSGIGYEPMNEDRIEVRTEITPISLLDERVLIQWRAYRQLLTLKQPIMFSRGCVPSFKFAERGFSYAGPAAWNRLPESIRRTSSQAAFKRQLKTFVFCDAFNIVV